MGKTLSGLFIAVVMLYPCHGFSQVSNNGLNKQRLLLELTAGFLLGQEQFEIDFDSATTAASRYDGVNRLCLIGEGFFEDLKYVQPFKTDKEIISYLKGSLHAGTGIRQLRLLTMIGSYYAFLPDTNDTALDSAKSYLNRAITEGNPENSEFFISQSLILEGKCYLKEKKYDSATVFFDQAIEFCKKSGDKTSEAKAWYYRAVYHPFDPQSIPDKIDWLEKAKELYLQLNNSERVATCDYFIGGLLYFLNKIDEGIQRFTNSRTIVQKIGFPYTHYPNIYLTFLKGLSGNTEAMNNIMDALKTAEELKDTICLGNIYHHIAIQYSRFTGKISESIVWYQKALREYVKFHGSHSMYDAIIGAVNMMNLENRSAEALALIQGLVHQFPPSGFARKQEIELALGDTYSSLKQFDEAEKHFQEAAKLEGGISIVTGENSKSVFLYIKLAQFYLTWGKYEKSRNYFNRSLKLLNVKTDPQNCAFAEKSLYQIDSATGHYLSAIHHLLESERIDRLIYNAEAQAKLDEYGIKYETAKKDNDILLYKKQEEQKEKQLKQSSTNLKIIIASTLVMLLLLVLLYSRYRTKQRTNKQLEQKQNEINQQNDSLVKLVEEKEWLLKEINHRVKNNLQIVMSLLNSQSAYLTDDTVLEALKDSQHRVHAISLIHQKLYQSDNLSLTDMEAYINDLVDYLADNLDTRHQVKMVVEAEPVFLDVSQVVPLGLIINEAVTNSIKYAFPGGRYGQINIQFKKSPNGEIALSIQDNGIGLKPDFDWKKTQTLGISLMKGLSKQLDGNIKMINNNGLLISIQFMLLEVRNSDHKLHSI